MPYTSQHLATEPTRQEIEQLAEPTLLEFGTPWCGHCQAAQAAIEAALKSCPGIAHLKFEDGPGRRLGRSFRVKLWPTLILMRDGQELLRLVRPTNVRDILAALDPASRQ